MMNQSALFARNGWMVCVNNPASRISKVSIIRSIITSTIFHCLSCLLEFTCAAGPSAGFSEFFLKKNGPYLSARADCSISFFYPLYNRKSKLKTMQLWVIGALNLIQRQYADLRNRSRGHFHNKKQYCFSGIYL